MSVRRDVSWFGVVLVLAAGFACGGGDDEAAPAPALATTAPATAAVTSPPGPAPTFATIPPPEGVESFDVAPSHTAEPVNYPQTPPVGGAHAFSWETCVFRDRPVASETAVHSLEHGAIWITYRPDLPADQLALLAQLGNNRKDVLVSRWDVGLPAPVVASSWGRQLKLESATDPRLMQFIQAFTGRGPESASC
jgi:hypothetical protein